MSKKTNSKLLKYIICLLLIILIISSPLTCVLGANNSSSKKVTPRNLAMFASLVCADLENIKNYNITLNNNFKNKDSSITWHDLNFRERTMVTDKQLSTIRVNTSLSTSLFDVPLSKKKENAYEFLFSGLASTTEVSDWKIVNYTKYNAYDSYNKLRDGQFGAMTFKRGNDIVIAFRATDIEIGDITQDLLYGLTGVCGQEHLAEEYALAIAEYYAKYNDDINIYITGWSLGGYLAQFGGAKLLSNSNYKNNVKAINYFNGIGLDFWSNIKSKANYIVSKLSFSEKKIFNSSNLIQTKAYNTLNSWYKKGGDLVSYQIKGDLVSALGKHAGKRINYEAYNICINNHLGNELDTNFVGTSLLSFISPFLNTNLSDYPNIYRPTSITDYVWITHEVDSFFGIFTFNNNASPPSITTTLSVPSTIKFDGTATATLTITTYACTLDEINLKTSDFKVCNLLLSNSKSIKITKVSKPTVSNTGTGRKYVYKITLEGVNVINRMNKIVLKPNVLKINCWNSMFNSLSNNLLISNSITVKLF